MNKVEASLRYRIYCDMDGVLTDFEERILSIGLTMDQLKTKPEFSWGKINHCEDFWSTMSWIQGGRILWNYIKKYSPIILSAHSQDKSNCIMQKRIWITNNIGKSFADKAIILWKRDKISYASHNSILIDDDNTTIEKWRNAGGIGISHINSKNTLTKLKELSL